jgi:5,10-methylenetetrahydromethanopterin reductase
VPGRVGLGLGRGGSSVRLLNLRAATVAQFGSAARDIQAFLRGERAGDGGPHVPWLAASPGNKVPLDIYATGPRVIALAGEAAERTTLAISAEADRIKWGMGLVRGSSGGADRFVGAVVALGADPDRRRAIDLARGPLSVMTHFRAGSDADAFIKAITNGQGANSAIITIGVVKNEHIGQAYNVTGCKTSTRPMPTCDPA